MSSSENNNNRPIPRPPSATAEFTIGSPASARYGTSSGSTKKDDSSHFGKRIFQSGQLETIGMSPANFRAGGKKHVPAPYSILDTAQDIIRSTNATPRGGSTPTTGSGRRPLSAASQATARKQERRLIESLIMFPSIPNGATHPGAPKKGEVNTSVPRAFQTNNVDWKPSGPHDHIPELPETAPKKPHAKLVPSEEDPKFFAMNPQLLKQPIRKKVPEFKPALHYDIEGKPKTTNYNALVEKLWKDMEHRGDKKKRMQATSAKEDAAMCKYGPNSAKTTDEDFVARFRDQALHTKQAKLAQLKRKYVPPLHQKRVLQKDEMKASTDRLYYQAKEKSREAHEASRKKYVEDMQPKFAKITQEQLMESANRLSSREHVE